jgi:hypothetical protein
MSGLFGEQIVTGPRRPLSPTPARDLVDSLFADTERLGKGAQCLTCPMTDSGFGITRVLSGVRLDTGWRGGRIPA